MMPVASRKPVCPVKTQIDIRENNKFSYFKRNILSSYMIMDDWQNLLLILLTICTILSAISLFFTPFNRIAMAAFLDNSTGQ